MTERTGGLPHETVEEEGRKEEKGEKRPRRRKGDDVGGDFYGITEAIRTLFGLIEANNKQIKEARGLLASLGDEQQDRVAKEFAKAITEVLRVTPDDLQENRRLGQAREVLEEAVLSFAIAQVEETEDTTELESSKLEEILKLFYKKGFEKLSKEQKERLKQALRAAFKEKEIDVFVAARENQARKIVETEKVLSEEMKASKEAREAEEELNDLKKERLGIRAIVATLLKEKVSERDMERVIARANRLGVSSEDLLKAFDRAIKLHYFRLRTLPEGDKKGRAMAVIERLEERKNDLEAEMTRKRREEEKKRAKARQIKKDFERAREELSQGFRSELAKNFIEGMTTLGELDLLIYRLEEEAVSTSDMEERRKIEEDLKLIRCLRERRARQLRQRIAKNPELQERYLELKREVASWEKSLRGRLRGEEGLAQLRYEDKIGVLRLLGKISEIYDRYRQDKEIDDSDWREFLLLEQGKWLDEYSKLITSISIKKGDVENQRKILRDIFESLLLIGESPDALYASQIWNNMIRFLENPDLDKQVREEFRVRMSMYRFSIALQTQPGIDSFKHLFLSNLIRPSTISTLTEIDEFWRSFKLLNEVAFLNDKNRNPLIGATAGERGEAFRNLAKEWLKREAIEAEKEFDANSLTEQDIFRAEVYIKEALAAFVVLRGCEVPNVARDWWWLHRLWQYYRRVTESEIGHRGLNERLFNFPFVALSLDENGRPVEVPPVYEVGGDRVEGIPVSLGLRPPVYVLIEKGGLRLLEEKAGYVVEKGNRSIYVFGRNGQYQELKPGEWFVAKKKVAINGQKVTAEVWFTKKKEKNEKTGEVKEKMGTVLHIKNLDPEIFRYLGECVDEGRFTSIYSTAAGSIEAVRKALEEIGVFFPPPEGVDVKEYQQELAGAIRNLAKVWGDHLPSIAATLNTANTARGRQGNSNLTEDDVRVPGVLYQEDVMAHFARVITEYYLGRVDPEILKSRIGWAPNIWASAALRNFRAAGLITEQQEREIEQLIWGKDLPFGIRRRAIKERLDGILLSWRGPFRETLLLGWLFFFLQQVIAHAKEGLEGKK